MRTCLPQLLGVAGGRRERAWYSGRKGWGQYPGGGSLQSKEYCMDLLPWQLLQPRCKKACPLKKPGPVPFPELYLGQSEEPGAGRTRPGRAMTALWTGGGPSTPALPKAAPRSPAHKEHLQGGAEGVSTGPAPGCLCTLPARHTAWSGSGSLVWLWLRVWVQARRERAPKAGCGLAFGGPDRQPCPIPGSPLSHLCLRSSGPHWDSSWRPSCLLTPG